MTTVSVIIPVYNSKATLDRAVMSVINETLVSEILIIDDGSTDGSTQIAKDFSVNCSKIIFLQHPNKGNRGASASRNLGLAHATSDWIQFLDADDELLEGKLPGQINLIKPELAFIVANSIDVFPNGRRHLRKADNEIWKGLIRSKLGITSSNLWNKKYLLEIGGWDENLSSSQEYDLMFRLLCIQPTVIMDSRPQTLIHKTENSISKSLKKKDQRIRNWLSLREKIRFHLIQQDNFGLKNQYFWSGSVGIYCELHQNEFPTELNRFLFRLYKLELKIKNRMHQFIKTK